jgi:uncharacterized protein
VNQKLIQNDRSDPTTPDMPKKFLQKIVPSHARIRSIKALHVLGDWIYDGNLWHINRYSASMAFFVGLFVAFIPTPGQSLIAATLAVLLRCNLPLSVGLVFLTNPVTMPPLFYLAYKIGALVVDAPIVAAEFELNTRWLRDSLGGMWRPFLLGCLICGLFFGSAGYVLVNQLWRWRVARQWQARKQKRANRAINGPD